MNFIALAILLLLAIFAFFLHRFKKQFQSPKLYYSALSFFPKELMGRARWAWLIPLLIGGATALLAIAFLDPHTFKPIDQNQKHPFWNDPKEGRILFLAVDRSGSMTEPVYSGRGKSTESKLSLVKNALVEFVNKRPEDLLGLVGFARKADILVPPTLDHAAIIDAIKKINSVQGTDEDGTAIGYAIYKTAHIIANLKEESEKLGDKAPYQVNGAGIVLLTDGLQDPNILDKDNPTRSIELNEAANYAKAKDIKLYVINVEPRLNTEQYLPNLREMERIAKLTGGHFYMIEKPADINELMETINELEPSAIHDPLDPSKLPTLFEKISYAFPLLLLGLLLYFIAIVLKTTWFRTLP